MKHILKVIFTKTKDMKYISHLDLIRLFARALRRSGLPFFVTEGFSPHIKFSITRALKLGVESDSEEAEFVFKDPVSADFLKEKLNSQLPEGIVIRDVQRNFN